METYIKWCIGSTRWAKDVRYLHFINESSKKCIFAPLESCACGKSLKVPIGRAKTIMDLIRPKRSAKMEGSKHLLMTY